MHPTRTGSGSLVPSRHGWRRTTSPLSPPGTLCTAAVTNCTDRYVLGAKTTQTAPTDTCKRPAQILGVFLLVGGFLGAGFWAKWADSESGSHRRNPASAHNRWSKSLRIHRYLTFIPAVGSVIIFHSLSSNDRLSRVVIARRRSFQTLDDACSVNRPAGFLY